jgi:hypothetical protein
MSLWGNLDASNNAPQFSGITGYDTSDTGQSLANAQVSTVFNNVTIGATETGVALGVFAVDTTEIADVTNENHSGAHAGWVARRAFTGPVTSITANAGAVGVNSYVTFSGGSIGAGAGLTGVTSANAYVYVNTAGYIVNVTILTAGSYANTPLAVPNTGNAVFTVTMGGRANRVQQETLVAMGSMTGDSGGAPY